MRKTVVIVEDEPITRMDISEILTAEGYNVVGSASDGFDAIRLCEELNPDLVLMDIKMEMLNGLKAARILIEREISSCIVILTAYNTKEFIEESKEIGVSGYVVKPVDEKNLIPAIEVALARCEDMERMKLEIEQTNKKLEERKIIEKAKGILIHEKSISEDKAYQSMRKLSMDKRVAIVDIAKIIIINSEDSKYEY